MSCTYLKDACSTTFLTCRWTFAIGTCADFTYLGLIFFSLEPNDAAVAKCTYFSLASHKTHTVLSNSVIQLIGE
jgi:hypothetical protein